MATPEPVAPPPPSTAVATAPKEPPPPLVRPRFNADYLHNPAPPYPALARRAEQQGTVLLRVLVNVAGTADQVEIRRSSGWSRLDQAALREELTKVARQTPQPELQLRADKNTEYQLLAEVLADVANAGATRVGFVFDPEDAGAEGHGAATSHE